MRYNIWKYIENNVSFIINMLALVSIFVSKMEAEWKIDTLLAYFQMGKIHSKFGCQPTILNLCEI